MTVHPPKTVDTRAIDVVEVKNGQSKRTSASEMQRELGKITQHVSSGLGKAVDRPNKDVLNAYAEVLKAIAEVEKALPTSRTISFRLTRHEVGVLFTYGTGGSCCFSL